MNLRSLEYAVAESLVGIRRNGLMSVASVVTIALSFTILAAFVFLAIWLNGVTESLLDEFEIGVFMESSISEAEIEELGSRIRPLQHVASVELITKEDAWEKKIDELSGQVDLGGIEENPLPDQYRVKLEHPRHTVSVANTIRNMPYVDEVVEARPVVEQVVRFADLVKLIGGVSAGALFLVTAFIISNTIRLTVYARRREIRIMQLVGATNWFIRLPLVLEGIILGAIGGGIAFLLITVSSRYITEAVTRVLPLLGQYSTGVDPLSFLGSMVALGCVVGAVGSLISIRRFLKI